MLIIFLVNDKHSMIIVKYTNLLNYQSHYYYYRWSAIVRDKSEMHNINILIYTHVMFRNIPSKQISR